MLRNAFENMATEATLDAVRDTIVSRSSSSGDAHLVSGNKNRYRREFNDATLSEFDVVTGAGMTVAASSGALVITSGTTSGSETIITTKDSFTAPFRAAFGFRMSSKPTTVSAFLEMVAETPDGLAVDETIVAAIRIAGIDSTSTTNYRTEVRNGGPARLQSGNLGGTATQTSDGVWEITMESDEVWFHSKAADSAGGRTSGSSVRNTTAPDPNRRYRMRIRVHNNAAPAASITLTSTFLTCIDYSEFQMEVTGGAGGGPNGQAIPVLVNGGSIATHGTTGETFETQTVLAANAVYTGAARDVTSDTSRRPTRIRPLVMHNAGLTPGILVYEQSTDATAWRETHRVTVPSDGMYHTFEFALNMRYYRFRFINGATAQTAFYLHASRAFNEGPTTDVDKVITYPLSTTALAAGGQFTSPAIDLGTNHQWDIARTLIIATQAAGNSNAVIQVSQDGTNWVNHGLPVNVQGVNQFERPVAWRYCRIIVNADPTNVQTYLNASITLVSK